MRYNLDIPDELHKDLKLLAAMEDTSIQKLIMDTFLDGLKKRSKENKQLANLLSKTK